MVKIKIIHVNINRHTEESHADYKNLEEAVDKIGDVARVILAFERRKKEKDKREEEREKREERKEKKETFFFSSFH